MNSQNYSLGDYPHMNWENGPKLLFLGKKIACPLCIKKYEIGSKYLKHLFKHLNLDVSDLESADRESTKKSFVVRCPKCHLIEIQYYGTVAGFITEIHQHFLICPISKCNPKIFKPQYQPREEFKSLFQSQYEENVKIAKEIEQLPPEKPKSPELPLEKPKSPKVPSSNMEIDSPTDIPAIEPEDAQVVRLFPLPVDSRYQNPNILSKTKKTQSILVMTNTYIKEWDILRSFFESQYNEDNSFKDSRQMYNFWWKEMNLKWEDYQVHFQNKTSVIFPISESIRFFLQDSPIVLDSAVNSFCGGDFFERFVRYSSKNSAIPLLFSLFIDGFELFVVKWVIEAGYMGIYLQFLNGKKLSTPFLASLCHKSHKSLVLMKLAKQINILFQGFSIPPYEKVQLILGFLITDHEERIKQSLSPGNNANFNCCNCLESSEESNKDSYLTELDNKPEHQKDQEFLMGSYDRMKSLLFSDQETPEPEEKKYIKIHMKTLLNQCKAKGIELFGTNKTLMRYSFLMDLDQTREKFEEKPLFEIYRQISVDPLHSVENGIFKKQLGVLLGKTKIARFLEKHHVVKTSNEGRVFMTCERLDYLTAVKSQIQNAGPSELPEVEKSELLELTSLIEEWKQFEWSNQKPVQQNLKNILQKLNKICKELCMKLGHYTKQPTLHEKKHLIDAFIMTNGNLFIVSAVPLEHFHKILKDMKLPQAGGKNPVLTVCKHLIFKEMIGKHYLSNLAGVPPVSTQPNQSMILEEVEDSNEEMQEESFSHVFDLEPEDSENAENES